MSGNYETSAVCQKIRTSKILLCLSILFNIIGNGGGALYLILSGMLSLHTFYSIGLVVFNLILLIVVLKSNFRFSYSKNLPILYIVLALLTTGAFVALFTNGIFTMSALIVFAAFHLLSLLSLIICLCDAAKRGVFVKILAVLILLLFLASSVLLVSNTFTKGYFGDGKLGYKNLTYELDEEREGYIVTGTVDGFGQKIIIPETFNDKNVVAIDIGAFDGITEVQFDCNPKVELINFNDKAFASDLRVYVGKQKVDDLKNNIVSNLSTSNSTEKNNVIVQLANAIIPKGLDKNEVFVTFQYTASSLLEVNKKLIPTWFGAKGDTFDLNAIETDVPYVSGYDIHDEQYLFNGYSNGGKVVGELKYNGKKVQGSEIDSNIFGLAVNFKTVYRIDVGADNDSLYEDSAFSSFRNSGYRYILSSDDNDLLGQISKREGFSLNWQYSSGSSSTKKSFTKLSSILSYKNVIIYPVWTLNAPTINNISINDSTTGVNTFTYGDSIAFKGEAVAPSSTLDLSYSWKNSQTYLSYDKTYNLAKALPSSSGVYTLEVTASGAQTSLTSTASSTVSIEVNKKEVGFEWSLVGGDVYSALDKTISCVANPSDIISGDSFSYDISLESVINAGTYTSNVSLNDNWENYYTVKNSDGAYTFTIQPYGLTVEWSEDVLVFDGSAKNRSLTNPIGLLNDGEISCSITSADRINAGSYIAKAQSDDSNYFIENDTCAFDIEKKEIQITYDTTPLVYNGYEQYPVPTVTGTVDGFDAGLSYLNAGSDAGNYTITAFVGSVNYKIVLGQQCTYDIEKKDIEISYYSDTLIYNGQVQYPEATVYGAINGFSPIINYTDGGRTVGSYTLTAQVEGNNYQLVSGNVWDYEITQKPVYVVWSNTLLTYNGLVQQPVASTSDFVSGDDVEFAVTGGETYYSDTAYQAVATLSLADSFNYYIANANTTEFTIQKKVIGINWENLSFVYDGESHKPTATPTGVISGDEINLTVVLPYGDAISADVGYYAMVDSMTGADVVNYALPSVASTTFEITQKNVDVIWDNTSLVYNGLTQQPTAIAIGVDGLDVGVSVSGGQISAGSYTATASISNTNYYIATNKTVVYNIAKKDVDIIWGTTTFTYNASTQKPTAKALGVNGLDIGVSVSGGKLNVGEYTATAYISNNNYNIANGATTEFSIIPFSITVTWTNTQLTYNGADQKPTAGAVGIGGVIVGVSVTGEKTNVGSYTATVSTTNTNYLLTNVEQEFIISPKKITISWSDEALTYNGLNQRPEAEVLGLVDDGAVVTYTEGGKNAGEHTVEASIDSANYQIESGASNTYTIGKRTLTLIFAEDNTLTYTGSAVKFEAVELDGVQVSDSPIIHYTYFDSLGEECSPVEVGEYTVKATTGDINYTISGEDATFEIIEPVLGE